MTKHAAKTPEHPCPGCSTAELTYGRERCHACRSAASQRPEPAVYQPAPEDCTTKWGCDCEHCLDRNHPMDIMTRMTEQEKEAMKQQSIAMSEMQSKIEEIKPDLRVNPWEHRGATDYMTGPKHSSAEWASGQEIKQPEIQQESELEL